MFIGLLPLVVARGRDDDALRCTHSGPGGEEPVDRRLSALALVIGAGLVLAGGSSHTPIVAVSLVVVGAIVGARAFIRLVPTGTVRLARGMPAAVALRGLLTFAFFGTDGCVVFTVTDVRNSSILIGGIALTAATLTWTSGSWIQERRVRRVGPQTFVRVGVLLIAAGIGLMILVAQATVPTATAVLAWGVAGLGMGLAYSPIALVVLAEAPLGGEGAASAALQLSDTLGVALGTGVTGAIVAAGASLDWTGGTALTIAFAVCAAVALFIAAAAIRLPALVPDRRIAQLLPTVRSKTVPTRRFHSATVGSIRTGWRVRLVQAESLISTVTSHTPVVASCATSTSDVPAAGDHARADTADSDQPMIRTRSPAPNTVTTTRRRPRRRRRCGRRPRTRTSAGSPITAMPPGNTGASTR